MKKLILALLTLLVFSGCASIAPHGTGRYAQIRNLHTDEVLAEMDTIAAGHQACQTQAAVLRPPKNIKVVCSDIPAPAAWLPYTYTAHKRGDQFNRSNPYVWRFTTTRHCLATMQADKAEPGTVILEDHCKM